MNDDQQWCKAIEGTIEQVIPHKHTDNQMKHR